MSELHAITLAPGEQHRFAAEFTPHTFLANLKTAVVITDQRVIVRYPHTLFGIMPFGYWERSSPVGEISEVGSGEATSTQSLLIGVALAFGGLMSFAGAGLLGGGAVGALFGLLLIGAAVYFFLKAHTIGIVFRNRGGGVLVVDARKSERAAVERARQEINALFYSQTGSGID